VHPEDLIRYGLIPEFVGRLPVCGVLHELDESALVKILTEPKNALVRQYQKKFEFDNVKLRFTDDALRGVAGQALQRKVGARGLMMILEELLLEAMYTLPSQKRIKEFVITSEMVEGGRTSLRVYTGLPGIPYNTRRTPKNEAPKSLKDMLKPQWKGKIASTPYVTSLNILAAKEMWGKEAALEYVRQLSKQVVGLIRCNEIERVASGEFLAFVMDCSGSQTFEAQAHGSPVEHVIPVDGAMLRHRMLTVPKNAEHPNAAKLFTTFMLTKEAQKQLWDSDFSDMYMFPESQMGQRVRRAEKQGAKFFVPTVDWVAANPEIDAISEEMVKIMTQK